MIELSIPTVLLGVPMLVAVLATVFVLVANHYHRRGRRETEDRVSPTLSPWEMTPREVQQRFDGVRESIPVDDDELARARRPRSHRILHHRSPRL